MRKFTFVFAMIALAIAISAPTKAQTNCSDNMPVELQMPEHVSIRPGGTATMTVVATFDDSCPIAMGMLVAVCPTIFGCPVTTSDIFAITGRVSGLFCDESPCSVQVTMTAKPSALGETRFVQMVAGYAYGNLQNHEGANVDTNASAVAMVTGGRSFTPPRRLARF